MVEKRAGRTSALYRGKADGIEEDDPTAGVDGRGDCPGVPFRLSIRQTGGSSASKTTAQAQTAEQTGQTQRGDTGETPSELGPKVEKIMGSEPYRYGEWGYLEVDPSNGSTVRSLGPADRLYIPGSSTKLFSVSATLDDLGFGHRFKTPVYAQGKVKNGTLHGNLVVNGSRAKNVNRVLEIFDNVNDIAAILQEESPHQAGTSHDN